MLSLHFKRKHHPHTSCSYYRKLFNMSHFTPRRGFLSANKFLHRSAAPSAHTLKLTCLPCAALGALSDPGLSLPGSSRRIITKLLLSGVFSYLFVRVLLSRVSFEPNRVPSSRGRWHLRKALNFDWARGAEGTPSSSSSSGPVRSSSSWQTAGRGHSSALRTEEKNSWDSDRLWKRLARSTCSPGHLLTSAPLSTSGIGSVPRALFSVEIIHRVFYSPHAQLRQITEIRQEEGGACVWQLACAHTYTRAQSEDDRWVSACRHQRCTTPSQWMERKMLCASPPHLLSWVDQFLGFHVCCFDELLQWYCVFICVTQMVFNEKNISDPGFKWPSEPELQLTTAI